MPHKKGKMGYKSQRYGKSMKSDLHSKRGGWSDMSDGYDRHEYGYKEGFGDVADGMYKEREGWGDMGDGKYGKKIKYSPRGGSAQNSDKFKSRRGWSDHGVEHRYQDGGIVGAKMNALNNLKDQMSSMGGDSLFDSLNENAYKDGGVVKTSVIAKDKKSLKKGLKEASQMMGNKYKDGGMKYEDGGIVGSEYESEESEFEDSDDRYSDLSREELLALLKNR